MSEDPEPRVETFGDVGALEVRSFRAGRDQVIALAGELDLATVGLLETSLAAARATTRGRIVLDLSALEFVDSSGIKVIIEIHRRIGDRLVLVRGPRPIDRLFELCGLDARLVFVDRAPRPEEPGPASAGIVDDSASVTHADREPQAGRDGEGRDRTVRRAADAVMASAIRALRTRPAPLDPARR